MSVFTTLLIVFAATLSIHTFKGFVTIRVKYLLGEIQMHVVTRINSISFFGKREVLYNLGNALDMAQDVVTKCNPKQNRLNSQIKLETYLDSATHDDYFEQLVNSGNQEPLNEPAGVFRWQDAGNTDGEINQSLKDIVNRTFFESDDAFTNTVQYSTEVRAKAYRLFADKLRDVLDKTERHQKLDKGSLERFLEALKPQLKESDKKLPKKDIDAFNEIMNAKKIDYLS